MNTIITLGNFTVIADIRFAGYTHLISLDGNYLGLMYTTDWEKSFFAVLEDLTAKDVEFLQVMHELGYEIIP